MGYVEMLFPDKSGIKIEGGKMGEVKWEFCDKCQDIVLHGVDDPNSGIFICEKCLNASHESA